MRLIYPRTHSGVSHQPLSLQNLAGKSFKTEVVRNGVVVGAAWSIGSGGDVAAEVNHPGGE